MTLDTRGSARKRLSLLTVLALVVGLLAVMTPASGQTAEDSTAYGDDYLIVSLNGTALAHDDATKTQGRFDPASQGYARQLERLERLHDKFVSNLARVAPEAEVVDHFYVTANAVVIKLNGSDRNDIGRISGVSRTQDSALYRMSTADPSMNESLPLINAINFWAANAGRADAGAGVKIGIIDSGIDPNHDFFHCKAINFGGVYYSGVPVLQGNPALPYFGYPPYYVPGPGDFFYLSDPHGTHVAGTAAGCVTTITDGPWAGTELSGVAPKAELYDYNVFPGYGAGWVAFGGSAFSHDIAAAIEDAVLDGMDVINMSLGGGVQGPHDFLAEASNNAVEAGVVVVTSAGNSGPGYYTVGSPGSASEVITVGATTNTHELRVDVITPNASYFAAGGEFDDFDGGPYDLIDWPGSDNAACTSDVAEDSLNLEVVLISRGGCTFASKVANAAAAGAGGVIVYNNVPGAGPIAMAGTGLIPAVMVGTDDGAALEAEISDAGGLLALVTITAPYVNSGLTADVIADFSSKGPAPFTSIVKPDVMAPGVNILSSVYTSAWPFPTSPLGANSGWELYGGTSMSSPHVAGAAAALLGEHDWSPDQVKSAFVNLADKDRPTDMNSGPLTVFEQGGGILDLFAADGAMTWFYPSNASFGIMKGNRPANRSVDISITGAACSDGSAYVSGSPYASAEVSGSTLTVEFDGGRDAGTDFYGGYVELTCGGVDYTIPWGGVVRR